MYLRILNLGEILGFKSAGSCVSLDIEAFQQNPTFDAV